MVLATFIAFYILLLSLIICCCSVTKSHPTLCNPMDCSMLGLAALHYLLEFAQTYSLSQGCHPTISFSLAPFSCLQSFPSSGSFTMSQHFASGGQSTGASASASVLPMNIQSWYPLGLNDLISLLSKGLSRIFSSTSLKASILWLSVFLWSSSHICTWLLDKP